MKLINCRSPENHVLQRLEQVFNKFSESIRSFELGSSVMKGAEVAYLLNIISRVEEILFFDVEFSEEIEQSAVDLNLYKLWKFSFHLCNVKIPRIVLKLPPSVLTSFSIENSILKQDTLEKIFVNQRNIQELEFDPYYVNTTSVQHLKLKRMKLMCNRNVLDLVKNQKQLKLLDLSKAHIGDNGFLEVCNLKTLNSLKLWIDRVSWELLENLNELQNLNELSLNYDRLEVEYITSLSRVQMPNIRKLKIKFPRLKITAASFAEIAMNLPNVTHLNISSLSIGVLGDLITSFKNLETLVIGCDSDSSEVVDFPLKDVKHLKLKELCIYSYSGNQKELKCSATILELTNSLLPNLEKIKFRNVINLYATELNGLFNILAFHPNLTHFSIDLPETSTVIDNMFLMILQDRGKKLEHFQMRGAELLVHRKVIEKQFHLQFSMIKVNPWKHQVVLRNVKWSHSDC